MATKKLTKKQLKGLSQRMFYLSVASSICESLEEQLLADRLAELAIDIKDYIDANS